jgi:regulation of enolase protein 1 (concanavalin A-like superfamily)
MLTKRNMTRIKNAILHSGINLRADNCEWMKAVINSAQKMAFFIVTAMKTSNLTKAIINQIIETCHT